MHDKSHTQLQRIRRMETHCKWTLSGNNKCWVPGDSLWTCSMGVIRLRGRAVDQRRESARRRSESARRGGRGMGFQILSPHQPTGHLCRGALGDFSSPAIYKAQLIPAGDQVQAPPKTFAVCFFADTLALP